MPNVVVSLAGVILCRARAGNNLGLLLLLLAGPVWAQPVELNGCEPPKPSAGVPEEDAVRWKAQEAGLDKVDVFARLIYSEALSTGYWAGRCAVDGGANALFTGIGWGIANRFGRGAAGAPAKAVYDTVFARNQFRTSFSGRGRPNPFAAAFLCPLGARDYLAGQPGAPAAETLWTQARHAAESILGQLERGTPAPAAYRDVTNFFYPHSERYGEMRPAWAPDPVAGRNRGHLPLLASERPCVEFYNLGSGHP